MFIFIVYACNSHKMQTLIKTSQCQFTFQTFTIYIYYEGKKYFKNLGAVRAATPSLTCNFVGVVKHF